MNREKLNEAITSAVKAHQLELYGVLFTQDSAFVYIKNPEGTSIKDCEKVLKQISYTIDTSDIHLEVESASIYAPLLEPKHYEPHLGKKIKCYTLTHKKPLTGSISEILDTGIILEKHNQEKETIYWKNIRKSTLKQTGAVA
ncbi:hypothetical protein MMH89_01500 [Candidatus Comchoanobacter bicostacola]|uniref:Ribosome maturation factor RimP n=1 Tax=Candidatus Comchoanobacter bicostacola TaxID=2919598 RepID=A0ABY5DLR3_9GAMM|nr:hypothetical protein [Candidatus Comchoanobacter bicostacola]UTC24827.1 hypothetical protein MMH89_01500 [Candidatus Comchoanobacter bicostacola]